MFQRRISSISIIILFGLAWPLGCFAQGYGTPWQDYNSGFTGGTAGETVNSGFGNTRTRAMPGQAAPRPRPGGETGNSTMASLEQTLDAADNRASWEQTPISGVPNKPAANTRPLYSQNRAQRPGWNPGAGANAMSGLFPKMSRQELLRIFMEGGSPQMGGGSGGGAPPPKNNTANTSTAYSNYQTAENESAKAQDEANKAYNGDKWNAKEAASAAEYAANNANYAAQRAESAAYNGDSEAKGYANLARMAADRARGSADQARYNADTKQ